ncbi:MAG: NADH-quinone oxidoreductase subunit M [Myxococcota bacterium]
MPLNEIMALQQVGFPILTTLILLPVAAIFALLVAPVSWSRRVGYVAAALELALSVLLVARFRPGVADMQFVERASWIPTLGVNWHVGVDGISLLFIPLTCLLTLLVLIQRAPSAKVHPRGWLACMLGLQAATVGVFAALDLILFFIFWELTLIPTFFLVSRWGFGPHRRFAAVKYVVFMLVGSAPLLVANIILGTHAARITGNFVGAFDLTALLATPLPVELQTQVLFLLVLGFAVKAPMFPFHTWLPALLLEGPVGIGVFMVGVKLGIYGLVRLAIPLAPDAAREWATAGMAWGLVGVLYGALVALSQDNLRRMLAFLGVSHVGLMVMGLFSLNVQGVQGALLVMLNMGITSTGLMFLLGALYARTGSSDLTALGGLARHAPMLTTAFFVLALGSMGVPGTSGFSSEQVLLLGAFKAHGGWAAAALVGALVGAAALIWAFQRAFVGPASPRRVDDLLPREKAVAAVLVVLVLALGLHPRPVMETSRAAVDAFHQRLNLRVTASR